MSNQVDVISFPREIAEAACWLASDASIMCTGSVLAANGGVIFFGNDQAEFTDQPVGFSGDGRLQTILDHSLRNSSTANSGNPASG